MFKLIIAVSSHLWQNLFMKSHLLQTFTANFDVEEDRIRLDCILVSGKEVQIYFTNRLSINFIKELVKQIGYISTVGTSNTLAQNFSLFSSRKHKPVSIFKEDAKSWLTKSIDFVKLEKTLRVIFKDNELNAVHLQGEEILFRNILDVFYRVFLKAGWDTRIFPSWVNLSKNVIGSTASVH